MSNFIDVFTSLCLLLAGIAVFLLGIKYISNGLDKGAGKGIKKMFVRVGDNRFANAGIGAGATAITQSSTAVTVMVVGFANAGVITLVQATAMIMGANVGTTFTAFFAVIDALPISPVFMMSGIIGISMLMFSKKQKIKIAGEIIIGISLIFVGMHLMGRAFRGGILASAFESIFVTLSTNPLGPLLLVLIGAIFTAIIQSSTAATATAVLMAGTRIYESLYVYVYGVGYTLTNTFVGYVLPIDAAMFIIFGANIGTTLTAIIASIGTSTIAKRAALTHLMYNLFGLVIFLPILWVFRTQTADFLLRISNPLISTLPIDGGVPALAAAFFHLFYNILLFLALIGFVKPFTIMISKMTPAKEGEQLEDLRLHYIDDKAPIAVKESGMSAAEAALEARTIVIETVHKEIHNMASLAHENFLTALNTTFVPDLAEKNKIISVEQQINFINKGIGKHLIKLSKMQMFTESNEKETKAFNSLHHIISDIERIGDQAMVILDETNEMVEHKIVFSASAIEELKEMSALVSQLYPLAMEIFESRDKSRLPEIADFSKQISEKKRELGFKHISRLNKGLCSVENGIHFYAIVASIDTIKDHLTNIAYSIKSPAGTQLERLKKQSKENVKQRAARKNVYW